MLPDDQAALLPDEIRSDPSLQSFNDVGSLAKSYLETKSMVGRSIQLPAKESKPEDIDKWANETGGKLKDFGYTVAKPGEPAPKGPDEYQFTVEGVTPEQLAEDIGVKAFRTFAHQNGLSNKKAQDFVNFYAKEIVPKLYQEINANSPQMIETPEERDKILNEVFRGETKQVLEWRDRGILELKKDIPELGDLLQGTAPYGAPWMPIGDHPGMVKLLKWAAEQKQPDFGGHVSGLTATDTMDTVDGEISTLRAQANGTTDQIEREKIGDKIATLYKKKAALQMRNGRAS